MPKDDFLFLANCCVPAPTNNGEKDASISERCGRSIDSRIKAEESASPYNAE